MVSVSKQDFVNQFVADTDSFYVDDPDVDEVVIDSAYFGANDGTVRFEGYVQDQHGDRYYLEARVEVTEFSVESFPYENANGYDEYDEGYDDEEEDEDAEVSGDGSN